MKLHNGFPGLLGLVATMGRSLAALTVGAMFTASATAATVDWSSTAAGTDWASDANWVGGAAPADNTTTDVARFGQATYTNQPALTANRSVAGLSFNGTSGNLTIGGSGQVLTLGGSGISTAALTNNTTIFNVSPDVTVAANQTWTMSANVTMNLNGTITQNAGTVWTIAGSRTTAIAGTVNLNSSAGTNNLVHTSTGTTQFNGGAVLGADQRFNLAGGILTVGTLGGTAGLSGTGNLALNADTTGASKYGNLYVQSNADTWTFAGNTVITGYQSQPGVGAAANYASLALTPNIGGNITGGFGTGSITLNGINSGMSFVHRSTVASGGSVPVWSIPNEIIVGNNNKGNRNATLAIGLNRTVGTNIYGAIDHTGQLTLGGALVVQYEVSLANAINNSAPNLGANYAKLGSGGIVLVQTDARTEAVHAGRDPLGGGVFQLNGNISDGAGTANNPLLLSADSGQRLVLNGTGSTYQYGTIIGNCNAFAADVAPGQSVVEVSAGANLGTGNVLVMPGGKLYLTGNTSPVAGDKTITVRSFSHTAGVLSVNKDAVSLPTVSDDSEGIIALNNGTSGSSSNTINLWLSGTVGNGSMFLGGMQNYTASTTGGIFSGTYLSPGTGSIYRLGGAMGWLVLDRPSSTAGVLAGSNDVQVGSSRINGGGNVQTQDANDFTGTLTITAPLMQPGTATTFYGTSIDASNSPLGAASGNLVLQGARLFLYQTASSGNITSCKNDLDITSFSTLTVSAANRITTLSFNGALTRTNNGVLRVVGSTTSLGTRELITLASPPASTNGMVAPWIVTGSDNFANYTGGRFVDATYSISGTTALNTPPAATDVVQNTAAIAITGNRSMYALKATTGNITANGTGPYTLSIGSGGLIPNGVSIGSTTAANNVNIDFGSAEGLIYNPIQGSQDAMNCFIYGKVSGTGGLTKSGPGAVYLVDKTNDFTGNITVNQGRLTAVLDQSDTVQGSLGPVTNNITLNGGILSVGLLGGNSTYRYLSSSRTLTLGPLGGSFSCIENGYSVGITVNSKITGPGALYASYGFWPNVNVTIASSANDYAGGTVVALTGGPFIVSPTGKLGTGPVSVQAGAYQPVNMILQGNDNLVYDDGLGNYTYLPVQTTLNTSTYFQSSDPKMGSLTGEGNVVLGNTQGSGNTALTVGLDNGNANFYGNILNGNLTRTGHLIKDGSGTFGLYGANTYSGYTFVAAGTLIAGNPVPAGADGPFGKATTAVILGYSTTGASDVSLYANNAFTVARDITIANQGTGLATVGGLNTAGTATFSGVLTLDRDGRVSAETGGTVDFSGNIAGTGNLTKVGGGVVTLSGNNAYTGTTIINAGKLVVASTGLINNSAAVTVAGGATLDYQGAANLTAPITNNGTVIMNPAYSVVVANGSGYAGYQNTSNVAGLGTQLRLLDGTASADNTLATTWRVRAANETYPTQTYPPMPLGSKGLISDVVDFTGTSGDLYALQLTYDPSQIVPGMTENELVSAGLLYLAYNNGTSFVNAGTTFVRNGAYIPGTDLTLGNWGVDTTNHVAWAVVDHNSQWAVVPEPGTLALLAFGSVTVLNFRRKKKLG